MLDVPASTASAADFNQGPAILAQLLLAECSFALSHINKSTLDRVVWRLFIVSVSTVGSSNLMDCMCMVLMMMLAAVLIQQAKVPSSLLSQVD